MKKYALIERHTGHIGWIGEADSPVDAVYKCEKLTGLDHVVIAAPQMGPEGDWDYALHELADDFDIHNVDGTDENLISRVRACPVVNYVSETR